MNEFDLKVESAKLKLSYDIAPAGFEPASPDPESGRIDRYPTGLRYHLKREIYQNFGQAISRAIKLHWI